MVRAVRSGSGLGCGRDSADNVIQAGHEELSRSWVSQVREGRAGAGIDEEGADEVEADAVQDDFLDEVGLDPPPECDGTVIYVDRWW